MTDEEKACKAICNSEPCKILCAKAKCYLGGLAEGKEYRKELVKDIKDLQEQIEKMKCCGNCKHFSFPLNVCYAHVQIWTTFEDTISCEKWELAE